MSRVIKFRMWDIKLNVMSTPENNDATEFFIHFGNWRAIRCYDGYDQKTVVWDTEYKERYTLQQYIGINDKNGKGIYEGDILKYTYETEESLIGKCKFDDWMLSFVIEIISNNRFNGDDFNISSSMSPNLEVMGDIFENPELLKTSL